MLLAVIHPAQQRFDGAALVPLRLVAGNEFEVHGRTLLAVSSWLLGQNPKSNSGQFLSSKRMNSCGDGCLRPSGQAQRGQLFAGSPTEADFAARESFYYIGNRQANVMRNGLA